MSSIGILSVVVEVLDSMGSVFARFGAVVDGLKNVSSVRFAIVDEKILGIGNLN